MAPAPSPLLPARSRPPPSLLGGRRSGASANAAPLALPPTPRAPLPPAAVVVVAPGGRSASFASLLTDEADYYHPATSAAPVPLTPPLTPAGAGDGCDYRSLLPGCREDDEDDQHRAGGEAASCASGGEGGGSTLSGTLSFSSSSSSGSSSGTDTTARTPEEIDGEGGDLTFQSLDDESDREARRVFQKYHGKPQSQSQSQPQPPQNAAGGIVRTRSERATANSGARMPAPPLPPPPPAAAAAPVLVGDSDEDDRDDDLHAPSCYCFGAGAASAPAPSAAAAAPPAPAPSGAAPPAPPPAAAPASHPKGSAAAAGIAPSDAFEPPEPWPDASRFFCCAAEPAAAAATTPAAAATDENPAAKAVLLPRPPPPPPPAGPAGRGAAPLARLERAPSRSGGGPGAPAPSAATAGGAAGPPPKPAAPPRGEGGGSRGGSGSGDSISANEEGEVDDDDEDNDSGVVLCFPRRGGFSAWPATAAATPCFGAEACGGTGAAPTLVEPPAERLPWAASSGSKEPGGGAGPVAIPPASKLEFERRPSSSPAKTDGGAIPAKREGEAASKPVTAPAPQPTAGVRAAPPSPDPAAALKVEPPLSRSATWKSARFSARGLFGKTGRRGAKSSADEAASAAAGSEASATALSTAVDPPAPAAPEPEPEPASPPSSPVEGGAMDGAEPSPGLPSLGGPAVVLRHQITSAVDAIDQTVEAMIGLCLPPNPDYGAVLDSSDDDLLVVPGSHGGAKAASRPASASRGNPGEVQRLPPTVFQMAPKVEVTAAHGDGDGEGASFRTGRDQQQFIVCSTTEQLDDTRVVAIVGRDGVSAQDRARRGSKTVPSKVRGAIRKWLGPGAAGGARSTRSARDSQAPSARLSLRSSGSSSGSRNRRRSASTRFRSTRRLLLFARREARETDADGSASASSRGEEVSLHSRSTLSSNVVPDRVVSSRSLPGPIRRGSLNFLGWVSVDRKRDRGGDEEDLGSCSLCSMTSSLGTAGTHYSWMSFLSMPWFWSLVLGPGGLERELSSDDRQEDPELYPEVTRLWGSAEDRKTSKESGSGRVGMQVFAPVHVVKSAKFFEEAPPPTSPGAPNTAGDRTESTSDIAGALSQLQSVTRSLSTSLGLSPKREANEGNKYVTEDEKTITDGDSSIHTIRILRIPTESLMHPLPRLVEAKNGQPSIPTLSIVKNKTTEKQQPTPQAGLPDAPSSPSPSRAPWQPGMSARSRPASPEPTMSTIPTTSTSRRMTPLKSLADDLSHHGSASSAVSRLFDRGSVPASNRRIPQVLPRRISSRRLPFRPVGPASSSQRGQPQLIAPQVEEAQLYQTQDETTTVNDDDTQGLTTTIRIRRVSSGRTE